MQQESLHWIDPPDDLRPPLAVARELLSLYRRDFNLTTWDLCRILRCQRRWVQDTLRPELRHICISHYFRQFILDRFPLSEQEREAFAANAYFYSRQSLEELWQLRAEATQKTRLIDLSDYLDPAFSLSALTAEQQRYRHTRRSALETELHLERLRELLTGEGYLYYTAARFRKADWHPTALPVLPLDVGCLPLCTKADVRRREGLKSDTAALQWLVSRGAVRIQLWGKTLWSVSPQLYRLPLAVPLDYRPEL